MDTTLVEKQFNAIGARVKVSAPRQGSLLLDVKNDKEGEFFDLQVKKGIELLILDSQKKDRHLLLMARDPENPKAKFLCGHDERHWFTCAIPEHISVTNVFQAKQALKPKELQDIESREGLKTKYLHKRHRKLKSGKKIHRQGEFMFIPQLNFQLKENFETVIHKNEPMRGGGSNMHYAQFLYRCGGESVMVNSQFARNGISQQQYETLIKSNTAAKAASWQSMVQNPDVYVKGKISHIQHETVELGDVWHKVVLNTESQAKARRHVKFLD